MKNLIRSTTQLAMFFVSQYLRPGGTAVDATCGNGNDTVALARAGAKDIYAFDIQKTAIERTKAALVKENLYSENIHLIQDSHENMGAYIKGNVQAVVFNLGYLPAASKEIATCGETTVKAVKAALRLLSVDGLVCITMYSGHPGGEEEKRKVLELARGLDQRIYHAAYINMLNQQNHPPEILLITLKRGVEFEED
ncbi:methyltransferase domain-containing protein [Anaerovorax odorimutans]|uniref:Methyltransferase domain-containing protein n=1 Tax=Anaerovorax odorimutans TaxID=109327 RepID=A0ABT1RPB3_9FIRM|nr:class I SAM-dependent methyltransferase [Anaerovorax odorimutans]MCQ4637033.1 methyltransferase domain-containing protein [Anaerovorax odorimutans]